MNASRSTYLNNNWGESILARTVRYGFYLLLSLFASLLGFIGLVWVGLFGPIPDLSELRELQHHQASEVYTIDGKRMGRFSMQNRSQISIEQVSPEFLKALIAIEDVRFYRHNGIDYRALGRVFVRGFLLRQNAGGGSTLTQQLAKNLYPRQHAGRASIAADKIREMILAQRIEKIYSKEEILELYVNSVTFGENTWGILAASERFFNTAPDSLKLHQSATLAGLLRATTTYNPRLNPERSIQRRNLVLYQMYRYEMIDRETLDSARKQGLELDYRRRPDIEVSAPHYMRFLEEEVRQLLTSLPALDGNWYDLYADGLIIESTLDSRVQHAAERAVRQRLSEIQEQFDHSRSFRPVFDADDPMVMQSWKRSEHYTMLRERGLDDADIKEILDREVEMELFTWDGMKTVTATPRDSIRHYLSFINTGFVSMEPASGEIRGWVGSINPRYFHYDHVRARRPTGSAFKPVVYASALESGVRPCDTRRNLLTRYADYNDWTPANLQEEYGGTWSVKGALSHSVNTVAVELLMETGIEETRQTANRMGIHSPILPQPSIALGTAELSLLKLTSSYTAFVNEGVPSAPRTVRAIYSSEGELLYDFRKESGMGENYPFIRDQAFSEETAAAITAILAHSADQGSSGVLRSQFGIEHAVAGKTGTVQNFTDGWFIGMTPDLVFGSWVGGASPRLQMPRSVGFASRNALTVSGHFLLNMNQQSELPHPPPKFHPHQQNEAFSIDCEDYREMRFSDRVRDFFSGRDSKGVQIYGEENEEEESFRQRVRNWFSRDQDP